MMVKILKGNTCLMTTGLPGNLNCWLNLATITKLALLSTRDCTRCQ